MTTKYPVTLDSDSNNSNAIRLKTKVPFGDIPYSAEAEYSSEFETLKIFIKHRYKERKLEKSEGDGLTIVYSKATGRVYRVEFHNLNEYRKSRASFAELIGGLMKSFKGMANMRIRQNLYNGRVIVEKFLSEVAQNRLWAN